MNIGQCNSFCLKEYPHFHNPVRFINIIPLNSMKINWLKMLPSQLNYRMNYVLNKMNNNKQPSPKHTNAKNRPECAVLLQ